MSPTVRLVNHRILRARGTLHGRLIIARLFELGTSPSAFPFDGVARVLATAAQRLTTPRLAKCCLMAYADLSRTRGGARRRSTDEPCAPPTSFSTLEIVERFQRMLQARERSPCTVKQYGHIARTFLGYVGKPLDEVTPQDLESFREYLVLQRHYSKNSVYTTVRGLACLFRSFGLSAAEGLQPPRRPERLPRYLTEEETHRLFEAVQESPRDSAMIHVLAYCGLRVSELCNLLTEDIDFDRNLLHTGSGQRGWEGAGAVPPCMPAALGSPYIPVDSWVYPAMLRLYSLGFVDNVFLGMRPWTRSSIGRMMEEAGARIQDADAGPAADEAQGIYDALMHELRSDAEGPCMSRQSNTHIESVYSVARAISGTPLRDSYHLGSTIINDYGRPYENGFNNYTGASGYAIAGRFVFYVRGEFEAAPSAIGYSQGLAQALSAIDGTIYANPATHLTNYFLPQATIPMGRIASIANGRVMEAFVSAHVLNHEISFGKQDDWLGPGLGGGMAYSNNAKNIYSFRINRIEPLHIPLLSWITGPFRYDFLIGGLHGHTYMPNPANPGGLNPNLPNVINPGDPWVHVEKISFRPTENLEFGFERSVIWGGQGHAPITIHTFLKSFVSLSSPSGNTKDTRDDPGARYGAFDFSYRLPFVRKWLTLYTDSEVHDDVSRQSGRHQFGAHPLQFSRPEHGPGDQRPGHGGDVHRADEHARHQADLPDVVRVRRGRFGVAMGLPAHVAI